MTTTTTALLDAVKTHLDGASLSLSPTISRKNMPTKDYDSLGKGAYVEVFPGPRTTSRVARGLFEVIHTVFIAVIRRVDGNTEAERQTSEDQLIALAEEVENSLLTNTVINGLQRSEESDQTAPPFFPDQAQQGTMVSVIPITFTEIKNVV